MRIKIVDSAIKEKKGIIDYFIHLTRKINHPSSTLLFVCPNSLSIIHAAVKSAKKNDAPLLFTATLNQVDTDGGYTGFTPLHLTQTIESTIQDYQYRGFYSIALDHGGPWHKDAHVRQNMDYASAMIRLKESMAACIDAGYDLLHIDPTMALSEGRKVKLSFSVIVDRAVELIDFSERYRLIRKNHPLSYEVGTEEIEGGLSNIRSFISFLFQLKNQLSRKKLSHIWPIFIVGNVGTDLHTEAFDPHTAIALSREAQKYGSFLKGHYTDGISHPEWYPVSGMGGANIGPEFSVAEYDSLIALERIERSRIDTGSGSSLSEISKHLRNAVIASGRWEKWTRVYGKTNHFEELPEEKQHWLIQTGSRYIFHSPEVLAARNRLNRNLESLGINAQDQVIDHIEHRIDKYFRAFNLCGLNGKINDFLMSHQFR